MRWLLAACLIVLSSITAAETIVLSTMDIRRSPTSAPFLHRTNPPTDATKVVTFTLYTGDLWKQNPEAHAYMLTDGYITPGVGFGSLQGRGIIIGHTPHCKGVGFEQFGVNPGFAEGCIPMKMLPNSFYDFTVHTGPNALRVSVTHKGDTHSSVLRFAGDYESYDTIMGVAGDKASSTYGIFNLHQTLENE